MNTKEAVEILYNVVQSKSGAIAAKNIISGAFFNIITDLHDEGIPVTGEEIEKRLAQVAKDFLEVSKPKNDVA